MGCAFSYLKQCPEIFTSGGSTGNPMAALSDIPGFDVNTLLNEGLDGLCAVMTGK